MVSTIPSFSYLSFLEVLLRMFYRKWNQDLRKKIYEIQENVELSQKWNGKIFQSESCSISHNWKESLKFLSHCKKRVNSSQPVIKEVGRLRCQRIIFNKSPLIDKTSLSSVQKWSECVHTCTYTLLKYQGNVQNGSREPGLGLD